MKYADYACSYTESYVNGKHIYTFTGRCVYTGKMYSVDVPGPELFAYRQGELIQNALKSVSAEDREFLMSGISPEGWNA